MFHTSGKPERKPSASRETVLARLIDEIQIFRLVLTIEEEDKASGIDIHYEGPFSDQILESVRGIIPKEGWIIQDYSDIYHPIDNMVIGIKINIIPVQTGIQAN